MLLNWFIPGLGFWICRRRVRGLMQFLIVITTFILGIILHGGVDWPSWKLSEPDFNLINNFTLLIQLGAGLPSLASLAATQFGHLVGPLHLESLGGLPTHPYYELGGFYIIVAGAINYFATCNFHDRIISPAPRLLAQEGLAEKDLTDQS